MGLAKANLPADPALRLRPPDEVMRLDRLGSFFATRISFMRSLLRRMAREGWRIERDGWDLDADGYGTAVYRIRTPAQDYSVVAFSDELASEQRTDRVIAERWDASFALVRGRPTGDDLARLRANVPRQEAGRVSASEYVLSRANKSVRLFETVVDCLANGRQPDMAALVDVGYLMRTTAVYGNGKFGLADLKQVHRDRMFRRPFQAELLTVYLIRQFTVDLVEHIARARVPDRAVRLCRAARRALGIGNATGLGMAPFLVRHPILLHRWILARETAIARVRAVERADTEHRERFLRLLDRARRHVGEWRTDDARQMARIRTLARELADLGQWLETKDGDAVLRGHRPWDRIIVASQRGSIEFQELVASLILEPYPDLVDPLEDEMIADDGDPTDPTTTLRQLKEQIEGAYAWALQYDFGDPARQHLFWYVSEEKEEPRLGERFSEPGADREKPLGVARDVARFHAVLCDRIKDSPTMPVAEFLMREPAWRGIVRRIQIGVHHPYAEIRDNLLDANCLPIDMLRCKLSFFGATKFDPKSDRWTRITMFQGAPYPDELDEQTADDWAFATAFEAPGA